jgi:p-cumate 2,3-dioxygenase beta subunit
VSQDAALTIHLRAEIEEFLYMEAELLDEWRLDEWLELFEEGAISQVLPLRDPTLGTDDSLYLIDDDYVRLKSRVQQLLNGTTYSENPFSKLRRLVSNVRAVAESPMVVRARCNFMVHRSRRGKITQYVGQCRYRLLRKGDSFRITERVVQLDQDNLSQGHLGFIL